jgi:SAM-dependent methyltransferase
MTDSVSRSYDAIPDFGALYDSVPAYVAREDVSFFVEEAKRARGEVLELGCGTGRVLFPIARARVAITGIDNSAAMLARCRERLAAESSDVRARVTLREADVRAFDFGRRFALATAPFRVMQHQITTDDQLKVLDSVARHLLPGGRFVFDVFNPHFDKMVAADGVERDDTPLTVLPDGRTLRRTFRVTRVRWTEQVNDVELIYHIAPAKGQPEERYVHGFEMRWYLRAELEHLLARAGFEVKAVYGDFSRAPLTDASPEMVFVAERLA